MCVRVCIIIKKNLMSKKQQVFEIFHNYINELAPRWHQKKTYGTLR